MMKHLGALCALAAALLSTVVLAHQDEGDVLLNDKVRITELRLKGDYDDDDFLFFGGGVAEICASMIFSHLDHNQRPLSKDIELPNPGGQPVSFKQGQEIWWASVFCKDINMSDTDQDFYQPGAAFPYVLVRADPKQANAWGNELPGGDLPMPWHAECRPKALWEVNILVTEMKGNSQEFVKKIGEAVNSKPTQTALQSQPLVAAGIQVALRFWSLSCRTRTKWSARLSSASMGAAASTKPMAKGETFTQKRRLSSKSKPSPARRRRERQLLLYLLPPALHQRADIHGHSNDRPHRCRHITATATASACQRQPTPSNAPTSTP
jgi:hypothetical protein